MVLPIPGPKPSNSVPKPHSGSNRKKKKKSAAKKLKKTTFFKKKQKLAQSKLNISSIPSSMSCWAEHYTAAATWQLKHELAYWKAKAVSLEYENKILHDIVRQNYIGGKCSTNIGQGPAPGTSRVRNSNKTEYHTRNTNYETQKFEEQNSGSEQDEECEDDEADWEVSEEFVAFLRENAKYREDARREREKLKAKIEGCNIEEELEADPQPEVNKSEVSKALYGKSWQRIAALEMSMQSLFIHECDKTKPSLWPNIPLNFNC